MVEMIDGVLTLQRRGLRIVCSWRKFLCSAELQLLVVFQFLCRVVAPPLWWNDCIVRIVIQFKIGSNQLDSFNMINYPMHINAQVFCLSWTYSIVLPLASVRILEIARH